MVVDFGVRPCIRQRVTGDWILFAIELACPLVMRWRAVATDAVHRDFNFVAFGLVYHRRVLRCSRGEFRFRFFEFPDSHEGILGETPLILRQGTGPESVRSFL